MGENMNDIIAKQQTESPKTPKTNAMFEGKNVHQSPVDGKLLCSYSDKVCMQRRLNGYAFCIRHILEDKCAPFKQCQFVAKYNGSRCINPVPVLEERKYCSSHLQVLGLAPKKIRKKRPIDDSNNSISKKPSPGKKQKRPGKEKTNSSCNDAAVKEVRSKKIPVVPPLTLKKEVLKDDQQWKSPVRSIVKQNTSPREHYLDSYVFDYDDASEYDNDTLSSHVNIHSPFGKQTVICADDVKYQRWQLKKLLKMRKKEMSYSVFQSYVKQIKSSTDTNQIGNEASINNTRLAQQRKCSLSEQDNCQNNCLPYSRFCLNHICCDNNQKLFHRCTAETLIDGLCNKIVLMHGCKSDHLCTKHTESSVKNTTVVIDESGRSLSISPRNEKSKQNQFKTERKTEKLSVSTMVKPTTSKRSLKAHIQKKFSILPTFSSSKLNMHVKDQNQSICTEVKTTVIVNSPPLSTPSSTCLSTTTSQTLPNNILPNSIENQFVNSECTDTDDVTMTQREDANNRQLLMGSANEKQSAPKFIPNHHHQLLPNRSEHGGVCKKNSNFTVKVPTLQQEYMNAPSVGFNKSPIPFGNIHRPNFALPMQSSHSLKSLIRFTGPFTTCQGSSLISPPYSLTSHNQPQLFRFDPNVRNQLLPSSTMPQHHQLHSMHQFSPIATQTQLSTSNMVRQVHNPANKISPKSILVPSDSASFSSKETNGTTEQ